MLLNTTKSTSMQFKKSPPGACRVNALCLMLCAVMLGGSFAFAATKEAELMAHYRFNESSGSVVKDQSRNGYDGRIIGAVWARGEGGAALDFDGAKDMVDCGDELITRLRGPMTISTWVRTCSTRMQILVQRGCWQLFLVPGGVPAFAVRRADADKHGKLIPVQAAEAIPQDEWVMIAGVYDTDRQVIEVYVNGELRGSLAKNDGSIGGPFRTRLLLGSDDRRGLDGLMGETRLYNRALSADEIRENCRATRPADSLRIPACRLRLTPRLFCGERKVHAQLHLLNPRPKSALRVEVALLRAGDKTPLAKTVIEDMVAAPKKVHEFDLAGLEPGSYVLRATAANSADGAGLTTVVQPFVLPAPARWKSATTVASDKASPPWTPLRVQIDDDLVDPDLTEAQISVFSWGRTYTFDSRLLPKQISTAGHALLAEPIRLVGRAGGRTVAWVADAPRMDKKTDAKVVLSQKATDVGLTLTTVATIEFDGLIRFDCALRPQEKVQLESLVLEIPLRREHARLVYYYRDRLYKAPGLLPATGVVRTFNPAIWLGSEDYGLQWFTESDQNWYVADANRAIEIIPDGDKVILRLNLVTSPITLNPGEQAGVSTAPALTYTFGLQATPVRPVNRDAWDLRIMGTPVYNDQYALLDMEYDGKPALDYYADKGVKTVFLKSSWTGISMYPGCVDHEADLHRMVKACHDRGMRVIVYLGSYFTDGSAEYESYLQDFAAWRTRYPYLIHAYYGNTPPGQVRKTCLACNGSDSWRQFMLAGAERLMDEFDLDGFYLDGLGTANPCHNVHHGCGYVKPDGKVAPTYPFFACRDTLRRLRAIVKSRKPEGIVDFHAGSFRLSALCGWVDNVWDGESILGPIPRHERANHFLTEYLPPDLFRGQFLGRSWGHSAEFMSYNVPLPYERQWAMSLLHDMTIRPDDTGDDLKALAQASRVWWGHGSVRPGTGGMAALLEERRIRFPATRRSLCQSLPTPQKRGLGRSLKFDQGSDGHIGAS